MKHWQRLLGTTALLLSLTACNELGQCEKAAIGEGLRTTVYNPDGIYHGFPGNGHAYGDTCRVFANGSFTPVEGVEGLYRYAPPQDCESSRGAGTVALGPWCACQTTQGDPIKRRFWQTYAPVMRSAPPPSSTLGVAARGPFAKMVARAGRPVAHELNNRRTVPYVYRVCEGFYERPAPRPATRCAHGGWLYAHL